MPLSTLKKLPTTAKGWFNNSVLTLNTLSHFPLLMALTPLKFIPFLQPKVTGTLVDIAENWMDVNNWALQNTQQTRYHMTGDVETLEAKGWYMVVANHQSWSDILILQKLFNHQIPMLKFFLKQELIYVPFIGVAWWALDFPFMKRYSKEFLAKNPHMKGKDLEATRKACEKFKHIPVSVMNFLEGTRFSKEKHAQQQSPYKHLLKPKSAGMAYALNIMQDHINKLVDVTIYYADGIPTFSEFLQGKCQDIYIDVQLKEIPAHLKQGDYENDAEFKAQFQTWVNSLWQAKDDMLEKLAQQHAASKALPASS